MSSTAATLAHNWSFGIFLLGIAGLCAFMLGASYLLGGRDWGRAKNDPFESGVVSQGGARLRLSAKFYLVAMFFVIFDVEALFLFAWAVSAREIGWMGYIEVGIFIFVLLAGLVWLWRLGALDWAPAARKHRMQQQRVEQQKMQTQQAQAKHTGHRNPTQNAPTSSAN